MYVVLLLAIYSVRFVVVYIHNMLAALQSISSIAFALIISVALYIC